MVKNEWNCNITSLHSLNPCTGTALDSRSVQYVSPKRPSPLTGFHGVVTREYHNRELTTTGLQAGRVAVLTIQGQRVLIRHAEWYLIMLSLA